MMVAKLLRRIRLVVPILVLSGATAHGDVFLHCQVPAQWEAAVVPWAGDQSPQNKIDDEIDAFPLASHDIIVNFGECMTPATLATLQSLAPAAVLDPYSHISSVAMTTVTPAEIQAIALLPEVAFIEEEATIEFLTVQSLKSMKVADSTFYNDMNVKDEFPTINGTGITVAVIDSGLDEDHAAFAGKSIIEYNAITKTLGDTTDTVGHGTFVASIAVGKPFASNAGGVAPNANLVAIKVTTGPGGKVSVRNALQAIYDNPAWSVDVVNMSFFYVNDASDGLDVTSRLVDLGRTLGIVMVAAAGKQGAVLGEDFSPPASSTWALTVAAAEDFDSTDRIDDVLWSDSPSGPRLDDGDGNVVDELKPEVTAYGSEVFGAVAGTPDGEIDSDGTSISAPHVAGLAALILQNRPTLNAESVREIIISTAESRGFPDSPGVDLDWDDEWGWGLVDAFEALSVSAGADLSFPTLAPNPSWMSPDISTETPPMVGVPNKIKVMIRNYGPNNATDVRVHFGIHNFSATNGAFSDLGTEIVDVNANETIEVEFDWTPDAGDHQCAKISIGYGADSNFSNNAAQRNLSVLNSPGFFDVANIVQLAPITIDLVPFFEFPTGTCFDGEFFGGPCNPMPEPCVASIAPCPSECPMGSTCQSGGWQFSISQTQVTMAGDECPVEIEVNLDPPPGAAPGAIQRVHIRALHGATELGGVTFEKVQSAAVPMFSLGGRLALVTMMIAVVRHYWIRGRSC